MASRRIQAAPKDGAAEDDVGDCSSPPCYINEIDPAYAGLAPKPPEPKPRRGGGAAP